jgi:hypothetical protein
MGNSYQQFLYQNKEWSPYIRHISTDESLNVVLPSTESAEAKWVTIEIVETKIYAFRIQCTEICKARIRCIKLSGGRTHFIEIFWTWDLYW